jgi:glycerol kinase
MEHRQIYPKPDWVEHDPMEIKKNAFKVISGALKKAGINDSEIAAVGVTNQRETTLIWNRKTGLPYYNAIVWQDTRTDDLCKRFAEDKGMDRFREKVGLPLATYFSGPKIRWLLDNISGIQKDALNGDALFGNMDSWLIWWLTGGPKGGIHITDVTNASRTMLMNLATLQWDQEILDFMGIPAKMLPEIRSSSEIYGYITEGNAFSGKIPVSGILGDQQAALFGQTCFNLGEAKNTYGTGCFLLMNTGDQLVQSKSGLLTTVAYKIGDQKTIYALEGSIAIAGSLVQWTRDNLGLISASAEIESLAEKVEDNGGVYFVPAFSGLFAPHWNSSARGLIIGMTHYVNKGHIARAVLEASAFQTKEIFEAMQKDSGIQLQSLKVDGGMVQNKLLMQFQADILGIPVIRPKISETTVLGAAYAAGLAVEFWKNMEDLNVNWSKDMEWNAQMPEKEVDRLCNNWKKAVERSYDWI